MGYANFMAHVVSDEIHGYSGVRIPTNYYAMTSLSGASVCF
jgi:hypothetical protein